MELQISVLSKVGGRERNEDACGYWRNDGPVCCVLSDGAGGHRGGDVASRVAVQAVLEAFADRPECSGQRVAELIAIANAAVMRRQAIDPHLCDMRATIVVLSVDPLGDLASWGHIGDSRLYLLRRGFVETRTKDHSLLQAMIDAGLAKPGQPGGPERALLIASLGAQDAFEPELRAQSAVLRAGDAFLLCSDGFWEHIDDAAIETALQRAASPQDWLAMLERSVIDARKPSQDNYSAIAVWCGPMEFSTVKLAPVGRE